MPIEYNIDVRQKTVFLRAWDHVSSQEVHEHNLQLSHDPDFHPDHKGLFDLTGVSSTNYYYRQMKKMLPEDPWGEKSSRAVVVKSPLIFGLTRTFILLAKKTHGNISIFHNMEKATKSLDIEADETAQHNTKPLRITTFAAI